VLNDDRSVEIFAGVPYAQAPVGDLRWRPPRALERRTEVFTADRFPPAPIQATSTFLTRALSQVVETPLEGTFLNPYPVSEDSLFLNIWRSTEPESDSLPVLVYIPGGGFATGSSALPLYDGEAIAARGEAITITLNYRLGVFGFLSHPELAAESAHDASGNYGILDQLAALKWIRDNIANFGGDPERVTIAGESAGGESVCLLGATRLAEGLVDSIVAGSGACMGTVGDTERGDQTDTRESAEGAGRRLSDALGDLSIEEMRELPVERIVDTARSMDAHWRPSVDGRVLEKAAAEIYASGEQLDVPIRETYGDDAERYLDLYPGRTQKQVLDSILSAQTDSVMTRGMLRWARMQTDTGRAEAYLYFFSHVPPEDGLERYGAYHGAEVAYAYDNLGADSEAEYQDADYRLRDQMSSYWLNFVRTGDPNGSGLPRWPTVAQAGEHVMEFGTDGSVLSPRPRSEAIDFWLDYDGPIR
jgi:para-nitrobenzyl esterase